MPLRFPRPVIPVIAIGLAVAWVAAGSAPAIADQVRQQEYWLSQLDVTQAQQASLGAGVTVAVLSDGVDASAPDLTGSVTTGPDYTGTGELSGSFFGQQGTAAASIIAGHGNGPQDQSGVLGIAPKARILSVRVTLDTADPALDSTATGAGLPGAIASGIRYAVARHASVIDLPADPGRPSPAAIAALPIPRFETEAPQLAGIFAAEGGSEAEQQAVQFALSKGVVLVAPAGDDGEGSNAVNFPASYPGVIAVGAFDSGFNMAPFSAGQPYVKLTAAGVNVIADAAGGGYAPVSSTSAASAVVSGIAALIRAQDPGLSPAQVSAALTSSTVYKPPPGARPGSGAGSVDAARALLAAQTLAAPASAQAGARALALASPPPPDTAPLSSNSLLPGVLRSLLISAALLILLLSAVFWYAVTGRRRQVDTARATVAWARSTQNPFSAYGSPDGRTEADKMLEYFASPSSAPARADAHGAAAAAAATGPFAAAAGPPAPGQGGGGDGATSGVGAWAPVIPASRIQPRQARVAGAPPWEPAAEPAGELPWATVPSPGGPAGPADGARLAAPDADPVWPVASPSSSTSQSWDELAAGASSAARMPPADDLAALPLSGSGPLPSGGAMTPGGPFSAYEEALAADGGLAGGGDFAGGGFAGNGFGGGDFAGGGFGGNGASGNGASGNGFAGDGFPGGDYPGSYPGAAEFPGEREFHGMGGQQGGRQGGETAQSGSPWEPASPPRSPSGSGWDDEMPASEGHWPDAAGEDAYRGAPGDVTWHAAPVAAPWESADTGAAWQPTDVPARWSPDPDPWQQQPAASAAPWEPAPAAGGWDSGWEPADTGETPAWRLPLRPDGSDEA